MRVTFIKFSFAFPFLSGKSTVDVRVERKMELNRNIFCMNNQCKHYLKRILTNSFVFYFYDVCILAKTTSFHQNVVFIISKQNISKHLNLIQVRDHTSVTNVLQRSDLKTHPRLCTQEYTGILQTSVEKNIYIYKKPWHTMACSIHNLISIKVHATLLQICIIFIY